MRQLLPRVVRHGISAQLARVRAARVERQLARFAGGTDVIVAGPWLGEVGFELLYWAPFLAWVAERYRIEPERLLIVSRGGTESWYQPFASGYRDIFSSVSPEAFHAWHQQRVATLGEQKQRRVLEFEHDLLQTLVGDVRHRTMLHPSTMYELFKTYWWGHVGVDWVHQYARYRPLAAPAGVPRPVTAPYTAVKFYFNECFPATEANRSFVRGLLARLVEQGPVVSLTTGLQLDDHGDCAVESLGVQSLPRDLAPADNLRVQSAIVAGASRFVGTYGGFSYLAPFYGVPATVYHSDERGFSMHHLVMARSALTRAHGQARLEVRAVADAVTGHAVTGYGGTESRSIGRRTTLRTLNGTSNVEPGIER